MKRLLVALLFVWALLGCSAKSGGGFSSTGDGGNESDVVTPTDTMPSGDQVTPSNLTLQIPTWAESFSLGLIHPPMNQVFVVATISLSNMSGSEAAPLLPSSFSVTTSDGLVVNADASHGTPDECRNTVSIAPGSMTTCKLVFPVAIAARPLRMTYRTGSRMATADFPSVAIDFDCETGASLVLRASQGTCRCAPCSTQTQNFISAYQDSSCQSEINTTYHGNVCLPTNGPISGRCATAWFEAFRCYAVNCYTLCPPVN